MTTTMTTHIVAIGTRWNSGIPKWKGSTTSTHAAAPTFSKCMKPRNAARTEPATMPSSTATLATKPRPHLMRARMNTSTNAATASP